MVTAIVGGPLERIGFPSRSSRFTSIGGMSAKRGSSRASGTTSISSSGMCSACEQNDPSRVISHTSTPTLDLKNSRVRSTSETRAIGAHSSCDVTFTISSRPGFSSSSVSR